MMVNLMGLISFMVLVCCSWLIYPKLYRTRPRPDHQLDVEALIGAPICSDTGGLEIHFDTVL